MQKLINIFLFSLIFPLMVFSQEKKTFSAVGFGLNSLVNNTYSMESEYSINDYFSITGSIGETIRHKGYNSSLNNSTITNGNFFRIGPRIFASPVDNFRLFFDANYIYSIFKQDMVLEISDFYQSYPFEYQFSGNAMGFSSGAGISFLHKRILFDASLNFSGHVMNNIGFYRDYVPGFGPIEKSDQNHGTGVYLLVAIKFLISENKESSIFKGDFVFPEFIYKSALK